MRLVEALTICGAGFASAGFAKVAPAQQPKSSGLVLEHGAVQLRVDAHFDPARLRQVLETPGAVT